jgi:hypothetical protein
MQKDTTENRSKSVFAIILIAIGLIWMLRVFGLHLHLENIWRPFMMLFTRVGSVIFSWPMILLIIGLILLAGKRSGGWILIVIGGIYLIPRIFNFPDFSFSIIAPLILVFAGLALIIKRI